jgi:hypothetical protein
MLNKNENCRFGCVMQKWIYIQVWDRIIYNEIVSEKKSLIRIRENVEVLVTSFVIFSSWQWD